MRHSAFSCLPQIGIGKNHLVFDQICKVNFPYTNYIISSQNVKFTFHPLKKQTDKNLYFTIFPFPLFIFIPVLFQSVCQPEILSVFYHRLSSAKPPDFPVNAAFSIRLPRPQFFRPAQFYSFFFPAVSSVNPLFFRYFDGVTFCIWRNCFVK